MSKSDFTDPAENHPAPEDILLWQEGEIDSVSAKSIQAHIQVCHICQQVMARSAFILRDLKEVKSAAAEWNFQQEINRKQKQLTFFPRFSRKLGIGVAACLGVIAVWAGLLQLAPSVRAAGILANASSAEFRNFRPKQSFRLSNGVQQCRLTYDVHLVQIPVHDFCHQVMSHFQRSGVEWSRPLSVRNFKRWRDTLSQKHDSILEQNEWTSITTRTEVNHLRQATLNLRKTDLIAVSGRFEFSAENESTPVIYDVEEVLFSDEPAPEPVLAARVVETPLIRERIVSENSVPPANPLDQTEVEIRLLLHQIQLDQSVTVDVRRLDGQVEVWGSVSTTAFRNEIQKKAQGIPEAKVSLVADDEHTAGVNEIPWKTFQGTKKPLAFEYLKALYPNNPVGRQELINSLDLSTRKIAAMARARDTLLVLQQSVMSPDVGRTLQDLQMNIIKECQSVIDTLSVIADLQINSAVPVNYSSAVELYELVHDVVYLSRESTVLTLEESMNRIRSIFID